MIIAQITDFHLRAGSKPLKRVFDSKAALAACIGHLNRLNPRPDVVLATGDLVQKPSRKAYRRLGRMLDRLKMPVYVIPGNHDDRERMRQAFADKGYLPARGTFLHYVIEDLPLRLIGLDTLVPGAVGGEMCARRLRWLAARLAEESKRPSAIFMHHPPFDTGIAYMDKHGFAGADKLERMIRRHSQVEWVMCGHLHRPIQRRWAGTMASTSPSVAFQMALELDERAPSGFVMEPAACHLFIRKPGEGLVCHTSVIGDFGPRHAFAASK